MTPSEDRLSWTIGEEDWDKRLDQFLALRVAGLSRSRAQSLITAGRARVDGIAAKAKQRLRLGQKVEVLIPAAEPSVLRPEEVPFEILYEDAHIIVIDKPAGVVVHPGAGRRHGTLVHGLLDRCKGLSGIGGVERPGIVHRLDKDTSGVMVIAKDDGAHVELSRQFKAGEVKKRYLALVHGAMEEREGIIELPIGRNPKRRVEMAVLKSGGKSAVTGWESIETFGNGFSLLRVIIKTGRTHQIRVHMAHMGHPIVGDAVYGYGRMKEAAMKPWRSSGLPKVERQLLHASQIGIRHPVTGERIFFKSPIPKDMQFFLEVLRKMDEIERQSEGH